MRVLVITNMYPPHHLGGYELSCRDTVDRFTARGHDVAVLTSTLRFDGVDPVDEPHVHRELDIYWKDHEILRPSLRASLAIERHNQRVLAAELDRAGPDVVSFWNMGALSMGLLTSVIERDIPSVLVVCGDWLVAGPRIDAWTSRLGGNRIIGGVVRRLTGVPTTQPDLGRIGACCFVSDSLRRITADNTPWIFTHTTVTGSGIDAADFPVVAPAEPRPWSGRLLFVGRVEVRKGIETLLRALARLDSASSLDVVGPVDPAYRAHLGDLVAELRLGDRVTFEVVDRELLRDRYVAADALVFPSEWEEPFGLVPIEAMACGSPVVATGTGGSAEFLRDGVNAVLFPPGDDAALANAVHGLAADPVLRARLVEAGRATASTLTTDRLADILEEWHVAAASGFADGEPPSRPRVQ